jgi:hypothetical protein
MPTRADSSWPMMATIRARCSCGWIIGTFSTRSGTPS